MHISFGQLHSLVNLSPASQKKQVNLQPEAFSATHATTTVASRYYLALQLQTRLARCECLKSYVNSAYYMVINIVNATWIAKVSGQAMPSLSITARISRSFWGVPERPMCQGNKWNTQPVSIQQMG
jgi:hypothetical protein